MPVAVVMVASMAMQAYGMSEQNKAAKQSAHDAESAAAYNARVDMADAKQIELDADQNTREERADARVYLSRQEASYASAGVLNTGSALAVQAETAGRLEQSVLQERVNAGREVQKREASAKMGVVYGHATAEGIRANNRANMFIGGANILSTAASAYQSGVFKGKPSANTTSGMLASGAPSGLAVRSGIGP